MELLEGETAKAKWLKLQGDKGFQNKNYPEAHDYYRQAYNLQMSYNTIMNSKNTGIYKRFAEVLFLIGDNQKDNAFPNLTEAMLSFLKGGE